MKVPQISVFLENRAGRLAFVLDTIAKASINIRTMSLADTSDFGIVRLIVDDVDAALAALRAAGCTVAVTDVLAIEVADRPGGLAEVLDAIAKAGLNVEYMYAFTSRISDRAIVVFRFENIDAALSALAATPVSILSPEQIRAL